MVLSRPPFDFALTCPDGWLALPSTAQQLRRMVTRHLHAAPGWTQLSAATRAQVVGMVAEVSLLSIGSGAAAAYIHLDTERWRPETGEELPAMCHMAMAWQRTAPHFASMNLARERAVGHQGLATLTTAVGPGLLASYSTRHGGAELSHTVEAYVPVAGRMWMAVLSGYTDADTEVDFLTHAVRTTAQSLTATARSRRLPG